MPTMTIPSSSAHMSEQIAAHLGSKLKGGEVIELVGDLGGGKTTFVRGLARGLGSQDIVRSPSFTIANEYTANGLTLHHFDFYRLEDAGIMANELAEVLTDPNATIIIEWANVVANLLTKPHLVIEFQQTGENQRLLSFTYPKSYNYLIENKI